jgi:lipopolysaccharide transport system permease protein
LSPILYPPSAVPEKVRSLLYFNPITVPVEQLRAVVIYQVQPDLQQLTIYALVAWLIAWAGYAWFVILRRGFADVV